MASMGSKVRRCSECGMPFWTIPLMAPHKRFCSKQCRNRWHYKHRTKPYRIQRRVEIAEHGNQDL